MRLHASLCAIAVALLVPASPAAAQSSCAGADVRPTAANAAQVSDAIVCLVAEQRARFDLSPFTRDARLDAAALGHSADMLARGYFSHTTPEGLGPSQRAAAQGYTSGAGENIAQGYASARAVMAGWMASEGHCRNLLSTALDLGVGVAAGASPTYTQVFGRYGGPSAAAEGCPYDLGEGGEDAFSEDVVAEEEGGLAAGQEPPAVRVLPVKATWGQRKTLRFVAGDDAELAVTVGGRAVAVEPVGGDEWETTAPVLLDRALAVRATDGLTSEGATIAPAPAVSVRLAPAGGRWVVRGQVRPASLRLPLTVRVGAATRRATSRAGRFAVTVPRGRGRSARVSVRFGARGGLAGGALTRAVTVR